MSRLTPYQKAQNILNSYQQIQPRKYTIQPYLKSKRKSRSKGIDDSCDASSERSISKSKKDFSFCRSKSKNKMDDFMRSNSSILRERKNSNCSINNQSNRSFTSTYNKETRYDRIMKLKVKPRFNDLERNDRNKKSVLSNSFSSCSSRGANRQSKSRNKENRLDKIMQIKVVKPKVNSTMNYYQPKQGNKSTILQKRESAVKEWKECQNKVKKVKDQQEKEDRLWKVFERERELRMKLKKEAEERSYKEQRRKEKRFESLVSKEVQKIEKERELGKRKSEGFSSYLYPSY